MSDHTRSEIQKAARAYHAGFLTWDEYITLLKRLYREGR